MSRQATHLATLYAAEHTRLRRLLIRRGVPAWAAADAVQEAFLRLLRAPTDDVGDLRSYLFRTAGNIAIDEHRRRVRVGTVVDFSADLDGSAADPSPLPDAALMSAEALTELEKALSELSPRCREVLLLHKFEGLSYAEIAERLGIANNTVMVHMSNALGALKRRLREISSPTR
jgi:RNA polymerase sigma-70 factor (ECF subfamily)